MTREEKENALHCLKVMVDEEVCEECNLYGTTGTDHCEADCVRVAIKALEQAPQTDILDKIKAEIEKVKAIMNEEIIEHDRKDLINFINGINQCLVIIDKYRG